MKPVKELLLALAESIKRMGGDDNDDDGDGGMLPVTEEEAARELVATNSMDVVNARAVKGMADVTHVKLEDGETVPESGHWWRWRFDVGNNKLG